MEKKQTIFLIIITILLNTFVSLTATTIYVKTACGSDTTGNGSVGNAYKTFHKGYTMASNREIRFENLTIQNGDTYATKYNLYL